MGGRFLYTIAIKKGQDKLEQELALLEELVERQGQMTINIPEPIAVLRYVVFCGQFRHRF